MADVKSTPNLSNDELSDVAKYVAMGGLAGGSLAALIGAVRLLRNNSFRKARPSDNDDDVMYVVKKAADRHTPSAETMFLAGIGAPLAFSGGFSLANWLINSYMRNKAQRELDEAQKLFVNAQGYDVLQKSAGERHSLVNRGVGFAKGGIDMSLLLAALTILGSGAATYHYLKRNYPFAKPEKPKAPKKIVYVDKEDDIKGFMPEGADTEEKPAGYTPTEKEAAFREDNCLALTARLLCDMDKQASVAAGVIHTVAAGRLREFEKAVSDLGFTEALNITKGAAAKPVNPDARELATVYCTKLASFSPQFKLAVVSDFNALHPYMMKEAAAMPDAIAELAKDQAAHIECAARIIFAEERGATFNIEKSASVNLDINLKAAVEQCIEKLAANPVTPYVRTDSTQLSDGGANPNSATPKQEAAEDSAEFDEAQVEQGEGSEAVDEIDNVLAPGTSILSLIGKGNTQSSKAFTD